MVLFISQMTGTCLSLTRPNIRKIPFAMLHILHPDNPTHIREYTYAKWCAIWQTFIYPNRQESFEIRNESDYFVNLGKAETMGHEAIKLELIEWLTHLDDDDTISYLKIVKDSCETGSDWWQELSEDQKEGIERGLRDIDAGRVTPHDQVKKKYGL